MPPLPFIPLVEILLQSEPCDNGHGGVVASWDSHETSRTMSLVCRDWQEAGQWVLYRSIAVFGLSTASLLLRTLRARPCLGLICQSLVLGVGEDFEVSATEVGQEKTSRALVEILNLCPEVRHLQIRPLHESVRVELLAAVTSKRRLVSLVVAPRLTHEKAGWTRELFRPTDIHRLALPTLDHLELNLWTAGRGHPPPPIPTLNLRALRLFAAASIPVTLALLRASTALEYFELYTESALPVEELVVALRSSTSSMRRLSCVSNPVNGDSEVDPSAVPAFDRLLPDYNQLAYLETSTSEITPAAFTRLPHTLRHLGLRSYLGGRSSSVFSAGLLQVLRAPGLVLFLETFSVADDDEGWDATSVARLTEAFALRRITFTFKLNAQYVAPR